MFFSLGLFAAISLTAEPTGVTNSVAKPEVIEFGSSVLQIQEQLGSLCTEMELRSFDPPRLPIAENSHQQIDCQNFEFMGEPRLAEFVFADDKLQLVWILVDTDDEQRIIAKMRETYESDGLANDLAIGFPSYRTAWRFKPAEVLFYSKDIAPMFEARMGNASEN